MIYTGECQCISNSKHYAFIHIATNIGKLFPNTTQYWRRHRQHWIRSTDTRTFKALQNFWDKEVKPWIDRKSINCATSSTPGRQTSSIPYTFRNSLSLSNQTLYECLVFLTYLIQCPNQSNKFLQQNLWIGLRELCQSPKTQPLLSAMTLSRDTI